MPNPIFFHLPQPKRQRLMDAIWAEFTSVPYMDVSINRIIQEAQISRGSFYQYFSGKQDVFSYLLSTLLETAKQTMRAQLMAHSNDLFDAVLGMYDVIVWRKQKSRKTVEMTRLDAILRLNLKLDMSQFADCFPWQNATDATYKLLVDSGYAVSSPLEARAILRMILSAMLSNITNHLQHATPEETSRQIMAYQLHLIRCGLEAQGQTAQEVQP